MKFQILTRLMKQSTDESAITSKLSRIGKWRQYHATFCATLITLAYGGSAGWTSPNLPILQSNESPLSSGPIDIDQSSWIGATLCFGGLTGNLAFGWFADHLGRKNSALICAIPEIISWLLVSFASSHYELIASRFFAGLAGGGAFVALPLFISEIAEDELRGFLGSTMILSANTGVVIAFILGEYVEYYLNPWILITLPIVFLASFSFLPESPVYLVKKKKYEDAEKSLRHYRGLNDTVETEIFKFELGKLKKMAEEEEKCNHESLSLKDFATPVARRALFIGIGLMALNQFCGCFAMMNYTANIFAESGSKLSPNVSAIVVGFIQLIGSYFSTMLVERAGRKFLIAISALGISLGLAVMATYSYLKEMDVDLDSLQWIPLASFSFVIFIASLGVLTLPFIVLAEIMPRRIKAAATSFCLAILSVFAFFVIKYLPFMIETLKMHGTMFIFSLCSLIGAIFVIIFQPETKGKSVDEISAILEGQKFF